MKKAILATVLVLSASAASAQNFNSDANSNAQARSESAAQSGSYGNNVMNYGSSRDNTPGVSGPSLNNTSPCMQAGSGGFSGPGIGISIGGGIMDEECNLRAETGVINELAGRTVAIQHVCRNDESMGDTLAAEGFCNSRSLAVRQSQRQNRTAAPTRQEQVQRLFTSCRVDENGAIRVGVRRGLSAAQQQIAANQCQSALAG